MVVEGSHLPALLERLETDEELRDKFIAAEKLARREAIEVRARIDELAGTNVAALSRIAEEAGSHIGRLALAGGGTTSDKLKSAAEALKEPGAKGPRR
jgi:hypothetical protein